MTPQSVFQDGHWTDINSHNYKNIIAFDSGDDKVSQQTS